MKHSICGDILEEEKVLFEYEDILIITKYDLQKFFISIVIIYFKGTGNQIPKEVCGNATSHNSINI